MSGYPILESMLTLSRSPSDSTAPYASTHASSLYIPLLAQCDIASLFPVSTWDHYTVNEDTQEPETLPPY